MRIAIEGQRLFREKKHGMDMVALELIRNLQKTDRENEYFVFVKPDKDRCLENKDNFRIIELEASNYISWEQFALPKAVRKYACDLLHCTSNTGPLRSGTPRVVTLHDIIYMEHFGLFKKDASWYQRLGNTYRRFVVPRILNKCRKIITVSEFEKKRIADFFQIKDDRLVAVYNGVGEHFRVIESKETLRAIKKLYNLPERFLFFLGNTDPKKNTKGVLEAFALFLEKSGMDIPLIMPDFGEKELQKLLSAINRPLLREKIQLTGYIKNTDLPAIFNLCEVFLYPSLRESFGIPMLEAMGCGAPVITSTTSSMPEVSGGAALLVDPHNPAEIAEALIRIIGDEKLKNELISKGMERVRAFSWQKMAESVRDIYIKETEKKSNT
jgi:glycosyltransferase involved in cell wall biosynthesis